MLLQVPSTVTPNISSFPTLIHFNVPCSVVVAVEVAVVEIEVLAEEVSEVVAVLVAVEEADVVTVVAAEEVPVLDTVVVTVVAAVEEAEEVGVELTDDVADEEAVVVWVVLGEVTSHFTMRPAALCSSAALSVATGSEHPRTSSVNNKSPEQEKVPLL